MRVGIAITTLPNMLQDIVFRVLRDEPDFEVISLDETAADNLADAASYHALDVLVTSLPSNGDADAPFALLYGCPRMTMLGIAADGGSAALLFLQLRHEPLGELTPTTLVQALRSSGTDV